VTIAIGSGMCKLMHQNAKHSDRVINDRRDQDLMRLVRASLGRPMLTDRTVLGRPGVARGKATSNPDLIGERMVKGREHGTQFCDGLS
jgi:hypothetical protein